VTQFAHARGYLITMRVFCEESKKSYAVRPHTNNKMPAYVPKSDPIAITQNGTAASCWVRPNKPDSERVNFHFEGEWLFVDDATLKTTILAGQTTKFVIVKTKAELDALVTPEAPAAPQVEAAAAAKVEEKVEAAAANADKPVVKKMIPKK